MVKTSDPVRSRKLSTIGPTQYCGGGPRGNRWCRTFLSVLLEELLSKRRGGVASKEASIAQMVERKTLNLVVVGSIPTGGAFCLVALD